MPELIGKVRLLLLRILHTLLSFHILLKFERECYHLLRFLASITYLKVRLFSGPAAGALFAVIGELVFAGEGFVAVRTLESPDLFVDAFDVSIQSCTLGELQIAQCALIILEWNKSCKAAFVKDIIRIHTLIFLWTALT